jgi:hypothetical protein
MTDPQVEVPHVAVGEMARVLCRHAPVMLTRQAEDAVLAMIEAARPYLRLSNDSGTPAVAFQERVAQVLILHQRADAGHCLCGWDVLGASHAGHVAKVLADHDIIGDAALVVERVRKAFNDMWSGPDWEGQVSMGFAATFDQEVDKVLADFTPTTNDLLAAISTWIDDSPRYQEASPELADTWRVIKMAEEVGEAIGALMGAMGENPRKGVTHTRTDVEHEILDVATAGLGALMHFHDNDPAADVLGYLIEHIRTRAVRGVPHGLVMPAGKESLL